MLSKQITSPTPGPGASAARVFRVGILQDSLRVIEDMETAFLEATRFFNINYTVGK